MLILCTLCQRLVGQHSRRNINHISRYFSSEKKELTSFSWRTHLCGQLSASQVGKSVTLCGWIQHKRYDFLMTIRDSNGVTQVVLPKVQKKLDFSLDGVHLESVVMVTGKVQLRPEGLANPKMPTGEIEVVANEVKILNSTKEKLPIHIHDHQQANESLRMQYRYLDLRSSRMQYNLRLRSEFTMRMRQFLCNQHGFVDVETPSLFRQTPGGAKEFLVPTHQAGMFYTLPQSPQQFKQLLMVGGIDRYFQIARCYRDEGSRSDRQPEFTQVDIEMSFVHKESIYSLVEELLKFSWPQTPSLITPFPKMSYTEAIEQYGTDKPDTRFDCKIVDVTNILRGSGLALFKSEDKDFTIKAINCKNGMEYLNNKDYSCLKDKLYQRCHGQVSVLEAKDINMWRSPIVKHVPEATLRDLGERMNVSPGDVVFISAGSHHETCLVLGYVRLQCADLLAIKGVCLREPGVFNFLWVEDFPLFQCKEEDEGDAGNVSGKMESTHHPFTAPVHEHTQLVYTDPLQVRGQHYDLVLNGCEVGGGSIRIHDAQLQEYILQDILKEDPDTLRHLLDALQSGCPPHGGIALGLDRLVACLCGETTIRDVIAFPKTIEGNDAMSGAPSCVSDDELTRYHIRVDKGSNPS